MWCVGLADRKTKRVRKAFLVANNTSRTTQAIGPKMLPIPSKQQGINMHPRWQSRGTKQTIAHTYARHSS